LKGYEKDLSEIKVMTEALGEDVITERDELHDIK
jgi:hypothetical protein